MTDSSHPLDEFCDLALSDSMSVAKIRSLMWAAYYMGSNRVHKQLEDRGIIFRPQED